MLKAVKTVAFVLFACRSSAALGANPPADMLRQIPPGYAVISTASTTADPTHEFYFVALESRRESEQDRFSEKAPKRPLLIFQHRASGAYALIGRNDDVILKRNEGGFNGCDPFEDHRIAVKGSYFTVEQGVACGIHWTYYVTFRYERSMDDFVFANLRGESWSMNPSDDPDAEILVSNGVQVERAKLPLVRFSRWRPTRP